MHMKHNRTSNRSRNSIYDWNESVARDVRGRDQADGLRQRPQLERHLA